MVELNKWQGHLLHLLLLHIPQGVEGPSRNLTPEQDHRRIPPVARPNKAASDSESEPTRM